VRCLSNGTGNNGLQWVKRIFLVSPQSTVRCRPMCSAILSTVMQYKDKTFVNERGRHRTKFIHQDTSSLVPVLPTTQLCVTAKGSDQTSLLAPFSYVSGWLRNCTLQVQAQNDCLSYIHCNCEGIILWSVEANMHVTIGRKKYPTDVGAKPRLFGFH